MVSVSDFLSATDYLARRCTFVNLDLRARHGDTADVSVSPRDRCDRLSEAWQLLILSYSFSELADTPWYMHLSQHVTLPTVLNQTHISLSPKGGTHLNSALQVLQEHYSCHTNTHACHSHHVQRSTALHRLSPAAQHTGRMQTVGPFTCDRCKAPLPSARSK